MNDPELSRYRQLIAKHYKRLDELAANRECVELEKAYHVIEIAAQLAQKRIAEIP
jgi:hypothetical protein